MPLKYPVKERAWGTRYDTLDPSPPSPSTQRRLSPKTSMYSPTASLAADSSSPRSSFTTETTDTPLHDASIFVGSLPTNIEHSELVRRLSEHLSIHNQIKAIKVVRDSRGGVCGFVQCEDSAAAATLLQAFSEHPPRPFCGRFLRFEAAKAFRALLLSYRKPTGLASDPRADDPFSSPRSVQAGSVKLASAIRIFRPRNAKHLAIAYDTDALTINRHAIDEGLDIGGDAFDGEGLLSNPLEYDEKTLLRLVSAFGALETFKMCSEAPTESAYDASPNVVGMAEGVWEVKWKSREDSVLALLTLRRIPYLTVNWAHHHPVSTNTRSPPRYSPLSKGQWHCPSAQLGPLGSRMRSPADDEEGSPTEALSSYIIATPSFSPSSRPGASLASFSLTAGVSSSTSGDIFSSFAGTGGRWADQVTDSDVYRADKQDKPGAHSADVRHEEALETTECAPKTRCVTEDAPIADQPAPVLPGEAQTSLHAQCPANSPVPGRSLTHLPPLAGHSTNMAPLSHLMQDLPADGVDPRTVFVGGLSVQDTDEWDEQKLRHIFDRYGSIETIQIVRPVTKKTCFAFVEFSTPSSASRAVREQHNQIHHGRPLRVQLRDRHPPPRTNWRFARGRGRPYLSGPTRIPHEFHDTGEVGLTASHGIQGPMRLSGASSPAADVPDAGHLHNRLPDGLQRRSSHDMTARSASTVSSSTTKVPSVQYQPSHGPSSTTTSPPPVGPSPVGPPMMAPMPPHHMNMGYFPPQHWVQPYHPSYSYPMPVVPGYAYPGYPYPQVPPIPATFTSRAAPIPDSGSTGSAVTHPDKTVDTNEREMQRSSPDQTQPPLRPTGFIQNEQGTLIPVYQRDALNQYMASSQASQIPLSTSSQTCHSVATPNNNLAAWSAPPYPMYPAPYPVMSHPAAGHPQLAQVGGCWYPAGPSYPMVPYSTAPPQNAPSQEYAATTPAPVAAPHTAAPPNVHGQASSGRRGGFHHRQFDRGHHHARGSWHGAQHARFPDRTGTPHSYRQPYQVS